MRRVVSAKLADEMPASTAPFARSFVDRKANKNSLLESRFWISQRAIITIRRTPPIRCGEVLKSRVK